MTDPQGDTVRTLGSAGVGLVARLDSSKDIEQALLRFVAEIRDRNWQRVPAASIEGYSRQ